MKSKYLLRVISLLALFISFLPPSNVDALASSAPPPTDMFQLPWDQGIAWLAIDGIDNGTKRPASSSHNYKLGGAIDFAPHRNMITGEDTSNFWVTAAATGTVIETASCYVTILHEGGWITQYQFLGNIKVKLGDVVARNQRLAVIADGVRQKYCPGFQDINVPHLHFILRPTIIGATFAGWEVNYSSLFNSTTFRKGQTTVGLFSPLLNVLDAPATPTPTATQTVTPVPSSETPSATPSPTTTLSPTPTLFGPYVSTVVNPQSIEVGETALVTVSLNNVPVEGYSSAEFTCFYDPTLFEVSNITVASLFGTDPVTAINGPQNGKFIFAIAANDSNRATSSGAVFTFDINGLKPGQTYFGCDARVSTGNNALTEISSARAYMTVLGSTPTPNLTPSTPTVLPSTCDRAEFIADVNIPPGTVMSPGTTFTKTWRLKNLGPCEWSTSYGIVFFSGEQMGAVSSAAFTQSVAVGETVDISLNMIAPNAAGSYRGYWMFRNSSGANFGIGPDANQPWFVDINVAGPTLPASPTSTSVPASPTPTNLPNPSVTPGGPTPTSTASDWLTFTNSRYGFQFRYPKEGQLVGGNTDNLSRIDLPFVQGTNLREKYLEVIVSENINPCRSPLATSSMLETSETVIINGITFLKETGQDGGAGHLHQWIAYSTLRDNNCVSLDFILHSLNAGNFPTPPPIFDYAAELAVFGQIVSTYMWLTLVPTPTATQTSTATSTSVPTTVTLTGEVLASKPVTVGLYDATNTLVTSVDTDVDGTFSLTVPAGTYMLRATASGFLGAQASVTLVAGNNSSMPTLGLPAGDIDNNNVIDPFDALTIGMSYNTAVPVAADLNNDGIINVLDLELLARNYRKTGPILWE